MSKGKLQVTGLGEANYLLYFDTKTLVKLGALMMPVPAFLHWGSAGDLLEIVRIGVAADGDRILLDPLRRGVCLIGPFPLQGPAGFFPLDLFGFADLPLRDFLVFIVTNPTAARTGADASSRAILTVPPASSTDPICGRL